MQESLTKFAIAKVLVYIVFIAILGYGVYHNTTNSVEESSLVIKQDKTSAITETENNSISYDTRQICTQETCFKVQIADTDKKRQLGLMNRDYMKADEGMLFIFDREDSYSFWMKNTRIPLDIIRIDNNFKTVDIQTATPCTTPVCENYNPAGQATYVLEINAGIANMLNISTENTRIIK